ncbi:unnamed protein product [Caenorhabditis brenneri]
METLDDYMNRMANYLTAVREKDDIVTEGIKKIDKWEQKVKRYRFDHQKLLEDERGLLDAEQNKLQKDAFEVEQMKEKLERMSENYLHIEEEFKLRIDDTNKMLEKINDAWNEEKMQFQIKKDILRKH